MVHVSMTRAQMIIDSYSHLGDISYVFSKKSAFTEK